MSGPTKSGSGSELNEADLDAVVGGAGRQSHQQSHGHEQQSHGHEQSHQQSHQQSHAPQHQQAAPAPQSSSSGGIGGFGGILSSVGGLVTQAAPVLEELGGLFGL